MKNNDNVTRREFLSRTALTAAGTVIAGAPVTRNVLGANDRVNIAIIGVRGQGSGHIGGFSRLPNARVTTLCDIDENVLDMRANALQKSAGNPVKKVWDMRKVFEDKDIDAVTFAVPNHWHALGTIWACQAGKHVYVEKPACWGVWEGRQMINAARKHKVLVQVGFQNRSRKTTRAAMQLLHSGKLGKIYMARGLCFKPRGDIGKYPDGPMAEGEKFNLTKESREGLSYTKSYLDRVHYDMWIGPAKLLPFNRNRFHYNWHWQFEYGNGDTGNQGPHQFDVGRWGLNKDEAPVKVRSFGGLYVYTDSAQDTPNTQTSIFEYADGTVFEFCTRGLLTPSEGGVKIGNVFFGSEGWLEIDADGNWKTFFGRKGEPGPDSKNIPEESADALSTIGSGMGGHFGNFVDAVRSGKQTDLTCDIEVGYHSSILPCIANISYRMKRELKWDGKAEKFVNDPEADKWLKRADRQGYVVPNLA